MDIFDSNRTPLHNPGLQLVFVLALATVAMAALVDLDPRPKRKSVGRSPGPWVCGRCGIANEIALGSCWSCHLARELHGPTPTHIPEANRWRCSHCLVWNGILRRGCWHCGVQREGHPSVSGDGEP